MSKKRIVILGSTGSIGVNCLDVLEQHADLFEIVGLTAGNNAELLKEQVARHRPKVACLMSEEKAEAIKKSSEAGKTEILSGVEGYVEVATRDDVDLVVSAIVGSAGLVPTFAAIEAGKDIALANKETLVAAGSIVMAEAERRGVKILPVDSEHSAIFQSLAGHRKEDVSRLLLTASGGPFVAMGKEELKKVTARDALNHPTWAMGNKITIDSATLMNKGLEVIEARWLFDIPGDRINVVVHPQSIVHSMVEYRDGSVVAQMGAPDMRGPIAYALSYPARLDIDVPRLDLSATGTLTFEEPDMERFPSLKLCYRALEMGGSAPAVASAANEVAVEAFLHDRIPFIDIPQVIERVLSAHEVFEPENISQVLKADLSGREQARGELKTLLSGSLTC